MKKFRLPRKIKKKLKRNFSFFFYPLDKTNNSYLLGCPTDSQKEYDDYKNGILKPLEEVIKGRKNEQS